MTSDEGWYDMQDDRDDSPSQGSGITPAPCSQNRT